MHFFLATIDQYPCYLTNICTNCWYSIIEIFTIQQQITCNWDNTDLSTSNTEYFSSYLLPSVSILTLSFMCSIYINSICRHVCCFGRKSLSQTVWHYPNICLSLLILYKLNIGLLRVGNQYLVKYTKVWV